MRWQVLSIVYNFVPDLLARDRLRRACAAERSAVARAFFPYLTPTAEKKARTLLRKSRKSFFAARRVRCTTRRVELRWQQDQKDERRTRGWSWSASFSGDGRSPRFALITNRAPEECKI